MQKYRGYRNVQLFFQEPFDFFSETYMIFASLESSLAGPFHGLNKGIHRFSDLVSFCVHLAEFILGDVGEVEGNIELGLDF